MGKFKFWILLLTLGTLEREAFGQAGNTSVKITSIKKKEGQIYLAVFKPGSKFPEEGHQFTGKVVPVSSGESITTDFDLAVGEYAIAVFQDLNGNKKLDTGFFGIPKEPYAFSNNVKPKLSAPKFEACKFHVATSKVNLRIDLIN